MKCAEPIESGPQGAAGPSPKARNRASDHKVAKLYQNLYVLSRERIVGVYHSADTSWVR